MLLWILLILTVNGIISFAYAAATSTEPAAIWGLLTANFVFFLGITQAGILFSAIMRIVRSGWGKYYSRLGEILTLSFIPIAIVMFLVVYFGGSSHIFWWAKRAAEAEGGLTGKWLNKDFLFWRNILTMAFFYLMSYLYFSAGRREEKGEATPEKTLNVLAGLVMASFIVTNTVAAWDFGMMIIPHWESSIFPPFYWVGNIFAGAAFLFLMSVYIIAKRSGRGITPRQLDSMGKVFLGFALLWLYMFWSQFFVLWYGNQPELTGPLFKRMTGNFAIPFALMIFAAFVIPFLSLIFRSIKLCASTLSVVAILICTAMWINRYLMIVPQFADGSSRIFMTWTGISLLLGGVSVTVLSILLFLRFFPGISIVTSDSNEHGHH